MVEAGRQNWDFSKLLQVILTCSFQGAKFENCGLEQALMGVNCTWYLLSNYYPQALHWALYTDSFQALTSDLQIGMLIPLWEVSTLKSVIDSLSHLPAPKPHPFLVQLLLSWKDSTIFKTLKREVGRDQRCSYQTFFMRDCKDKKRALWYLFCQYHKLSLNPGLLPCICAASPLERFASETVSYFIFFVLVMALC